MNVHLQIVFYQFTFIYYRVDGTKTCSCHIDGVWGATFAQCSSICYEYNSIFHFHNVLCSLVLMYVWWTQNMDLWFFYRTEATWENFELWMCVRLYMFIQNVIALDEKRVYNPVETGVNWMWSCGCNVWMYVCVDGWGLCAISHKRNFFESGNSHPITQASWHCSYPP